MDRIFEEKRYVDASDLTVAERLAIAHQMIEDGCQEPVDNLFDKVKDANYLSWESGISVLPSQNKLPTPVVLYFIKDLYTNEVKKMIDQRAEEISQKVPVEQRDYAKIAYILKTYREGTDEYQEAVHALRELEGKYDV